jgi:hypothetical protein
MPITGKVIRRLVYTFCEQNNVESPFNKSHGLAGRKWLNLFLKRHREVGRRKAQSMNPGRAARAIQVKALNGRKVSKQINSHYSSSTSDILSLHDESSNDGDETSFHDIVQTPEANKRNTSKRRKALNYQAIHVTIIISGQKEDYIN